MDCLLANNFRRSIRLGQATTVVSRVNQLNIRSRSSISSAVLGRMAAGDEAIMTRQDGEWASITFNGINGWVHTDYITQLVSKVAKLHPLATNQATSAELFTVSVDALNVRKKADFLLNGLVSFIKVNRMRLKKSMAIGYRFHWIITNKAGSIHFMVRCHPMVNKTSEELGLPGR